MQSQSRGEPSFIAPTDSIKQFTRAIWNDLKRAHLNREMKRSPIYHLMVSNFAPDDDETLKVQLAVREAESQLESLVDSRTPPSSVAAQLQKHIVSLRNALLAIRRLPSEILQEIFIQGIETRQCAIPTEGNLDQTDQIDDTRWPWTLSQVSSRWRAAALATPQLWTFLPVLVIPHKVPNRSLKKLSQFRIMLERSRDLPIQIRMTRLDFTQYMRLQPTDDPVLEFLLNHAELWGSATVDISWTDMHALDVVKGRLGCLNRLALRVRKLPRDPRSRTYLWKTFSIMPNIQTVAFTAGSLRDQFAFSCPTFTFSQVRPMWDFTIISTASCSARTLHTLIIKKQPDFSRSGPPDERLTVPFLKTFHLDSGSAEPVLLDNFTLPALTNLVLNGTGMMKYCLSLIERSCVASMSVFPLQSLTFRTDPLDPYFYSHYLYETLFKTAPHLQTLNSPLPPATVLLQMTNPSPPRCSTDSLRNCSFEIMRPPYPKVWSLLNTLASSPRNNGSNEPYRLQHFSVRIPHSAPVLPPVVHHNLEDAWGIVSSSYQADFHAPDSTNSITIIDLLRDVQAILSLGDIKRVTLKQTEDLAAQVRTYLRSDFETTERETQIPCWNVVPQLRSLQTQISSCSDAISAPYYLPRLSRVISDIITITQQSPSDMKEFPQTCWKLDKQDADTNVLVFDWQ
ncbi:hypothetical protein BJ165DRAFT_1531452 [Panaeolus papilionaceus]|nr:hypothetical protein BJ165DRAFT_1531452 [Panaeolus papilionaceus]